MRTILERKLIYYTLVVLLVGMFLGYFGEGLLYAVTNRSQVLQLKDNPKVLSLKR